MASNVLPFFWHLASSSKDARLTASADLVSTLQTFQSTYLENRPAVDGDEDEEEDEDESDDESGEEVDPSDDEEDAQIQEEGKKLDKQLASNNAEDVVYTVKRLVRGLASSRESSRLGFAVALTEVSSTPGSESTNAKPSCSRAWTLSPHRKSCPLSFDRRHTARPCAARTSETPCSLDCSVSHL
jgi:DNA polymerase phi